MAPTDYTYGGCGVQACWRARPRAAPLTASTCLGTAWWVPDLPKAQLACGWQLATLGVPQALGRFVSLSCRR